MWSTHQVRLHLVNDSSQGTLVRRHCLLLQLTGRAVIGLGPVVSPWKSPSSFVSSPGGFSKELTDDAFTSFYVRLLQRLTARWENWSHKSQQLVSLCFLPYDIVGLYVPLSIRIKKCVQETAVKPLISLKIYSRSILAVSIVSIVWDTVETSYSINLCSRDLWQSHMTAALTRSYEKTLQFWVDHRTGAVSVKQKRRR